MRETNNSFEQKVSICREIISSYKRVAVGFSGGVDSTALLALSADILGVNNVFAVTATGYFHQKSETQLAHEVARKLGVKQIEIDMGDVDLPEIVSNPPTRCYHCKKYIFSQLKALATQKSCDAVFSGANADDCNDYRPGLKAEQELDIVRPFILAGITKNDIRRLAAELGLPNADKPSQPCLASRIPYNTPLTQKAFEQIEQGETILREKYGYAQNRLRHYGLLAKIELPAEVLPLSDKTTNLIITDIKKLGFDEVVIDEKGFRSGALNESLDNV